MHSLRGPLLCTQPELYLILWLFFGVFKAVDAGSLLILLPLFINYAPDALLVTQNINDFPFTGLNTERKTEKIALGLSLHSSKKLGKLPNWQKKLEFHIARTDLEPIQLSW